MTGDRVIQQGEAVPSSALQAASLAIFDLDRTLLPGSSLLALGRALVQHRLVPRRRLAGAAMRQARFARLGATDAQVDRFRDRGLAMVAGLDHGGMKALARSVAEDLAWTVGPGTQAFLELHRRAGNTLVMVSASPQELVDELTIALGLHRGIGTRSEVAHGRLTGRLDGPFCYGPGKLARVRDVFGTVDLRSAWAYADSGSDVPLLAACGHPVAVNPDRRLQAVAADQGWPVLRFT